MTPKQQIPHDPYANQYPVTSGDTVNNEAPDVPAPRVRGDEPRC